MNWPPTFTLSDRFVSIIEGLLRALSIQARHRHSNGALLLLAWKRFQRTRLRFIDLVTRMRAGTLPAAVARRSRAGVARTVPVVPPAVVVPRRFGWVHRMMDEPWHLNCWRNEMEVMLEDPELLAVLAAAPQMGRELRPLCHMLAIKPPPALMLPRRVRKPRKRVVKVKTGAELDRAVARMSPLAFANLINPEPASGPVGWRPPNKIGYSRGMRFPKKS